MVCDLDEWIGFAERGRHQVRADFVLSRFLLNIDFILLQGFSDRFIDVAIFE